MTIVVVICLVVAIIISMVVTSSSGSYNKGNGSSSSASSVEEESNSIKDSEKADLTSIGIDQYLELLKEVKLQLFISEDLHVLTA